MANSTDTVGAFTFIVAFREPAPEAQERYDQRADTLAAWLLARWQKEREEASHADHCHAG